MALAEAMQLFEEIGDHSGAAWALNQQGDVAKEQGDLAGAREMYQKALSAFRAGADRWGIARSLSDLGTIACELGEQEAAYRAYKESLEISTALEHRRGIARALDGLACLALRKGDARRALAVAAAASRLRQVISAPLTPAEQAKLDQNLHRAWQELGEVAGNKAWEEGRAMTLDQAVEYALSE
jgi:tetratricopeptide (TPR) repeat protein